MAKKPVKKVEKKEPTREDLIMSACRELNKQHGLSMPFITVSSQDSTSQIRKLSTGIIALDRITGGGFPEGKMIEIFGPESGGKTTIALKFVATQQKEGKIYIWFDAEDSLEVHWARKFGVKTLVPRVDKKGQPCESLENAIRRAIDERAMLLCKPVVGEHALDAMKAFCGLVDGMVVDSVPALVPKAELDGSNEDNFMAVKARMLSQGLDNIVSVNKLGVPTTILWINQLITNIGAYGSPEMTPGGKRLKFYKRLSIGVRRVKCELDDGYPQIGHRLSIKTGKSSYFPPGRKTQFNIFYNGSFDVYGQIIDIGVEFGIIEKRGSWFVFGDERIGQGALGVKTAFRNNPAFFLQIQSAVQDAIDEEIETTTGFLDEPEPDDVPINEDIDKSEFEDEIEEIE